MIDFYFIYRPNGFNEVYRPVGISHFTKVLRNSLENLKFFLLIHFGEFNVQNNLRPIKLESNLEGFID